MMRVLFFDVFGLSMIRILVCGLIVFFVLLCCVLFECCKVDVGSIEKKIE